MHRISPRSMLWVALLAVAAVGCGSDATPSTLVTTTAGDSTDVDATVDGSGDTTEARGEQEPTTSIDDDTTATDTTAADTTATETTGVTEESADVAAVCNAYLESISFGTIETGLDKLVDLLGPDAPPGVQSALDRLAQPDGDIESFFLAQNTLDSYVLPICRDRFSASIEPAVDDATAAESFLAAIRDGDRPAAERLAPSNVIVSFDWNGFPDATADFSADNSTVSMLLEPTVTVFCQLSAGAVESCSFGE